MIGRLTGILVSKQPPQIVIDAGGVGYEVDVSMQTFYTLPALGEQIVLHTQLIVREDAHLLFGFASENERQTFRALIKVGGIGAKTALGILSAMSSEDLARAIADEDWKTLSAAPGIGKKTAERMILELRGKLAPEGVPNVAAADTISHDGREDVVSTLLALGYNEREARGVTKHLTSDIEVGEGVRQALKLLMK